MKSAVPAPRKYGCPACMEKESMFFETDARHVACDRDGWKGTLSNAHYEQFFVRRRDSSVVDAAYLVILVIEVIALAAFVDFMF